MRLLIDTTYLSRLCHPRSDKALSEWLRSQLVQNRKLVPVIPAIVDYELRRGYLLKATSKDEGTRKSFQQSIDHLDKLRDRWAHSALGLDILDRAANLWAEARSSGHQNADDERLDIDVIIAAQALKEGATVLTKNERHFIPFGVKVLNPIPQGN